ncbi:MAG: peptidoglycan DD-metalloendopeptidase family protein [Dysgonamonadaceae bacterium]|nr:peptidoglycan DD-metalloendopeptidase family protein [Dysgonamonadaceae bacterium]
MMNIKELALIGCALLTLSFFPNTGIQAQTKTISHPDIMNRSKLLADRSKVKTENLVVDSMLMRIGIDTEDEIPADEIYEGNWNNEYVKAYANVNVPDTFRFDVSEFIMPIEGKINSHFGPRKRRFHYGTDIDLNTGDTVRAAFDGRVRLANYERKGYGNHLVVRHPNGLETVYAHLSQYLVREGESVEAGQPIALGGSTGRSTGPHLHFEFRFLGRAINPEDVIDFGYYSVKDDEYVYVKGRSEQASSEKYAFKGKGKIRYYRIKKGDSLGMIARKSGVSVNQLCRLNKIKASSKLKIGSSIRLS